MFYTVGLEGCVMSWNHYGEANSVGTTLDRMRVNLQSAHWFAVFGASLEAWNLGTQAVEVCGNCEADNIVLVAFAAARGLSDWNHNWALVGMLENPNVDLHLRSMWIVPSERHRY